MSYDPRAVKIPKAIKIVAAGIMDKTKRGDFIRAHVKVAEQAATSRSNRSAGRDSKDK